MELATLPSALAANQSNWVQFLDDSGVVTRRSFAEIHQDASELARGLHTTNGQQATWPTVAILGPPSYRWLVAAVACIYLGAEIAAIPESATVDEQAEMILRSGASVLIDIEQPITHADAAATPSDIRRYGYVELVTLAHRHDSDDFTATARFSAVAFTSGSSSASVKAFRIGAAATESFIDSFVQLFGLTGADSWAICHPFSHIVHLEYALGGLCHGYNVTLTSPMRVMLGDVADAPAALVSVPSVYQGMADLIRRRMPTSGPRRWVLNRWLRMPVNPLTRRLARPVATVLAPGAVSTDWSRLKVAIIGAAPSGPGLQRFLILMGLPMYEGYGMSETQMLTCNVPGANRFGTVGKAWPGVQLRLSPAGELEARLDADRTSSYLDDESSTRATFADQGWVRTGDLAAVHGGYWSITGRAKALIVLTHGKNVNPEFLERRIIDIDGVQACVAAGDGRPYVAALVVHRQGLTEVGRQHIRDQIRSINTEVAAHEKVGAIELIDEADIDPELFYTRSGKVRRAVVLEHFAARLAALYDRHEARHG